MSNPTHVDLGRNNLRAQRIALETHDQAVVITHRDCPVCRAEGFSAHARVRLEYGGQQIIATLYQVDSDWMEIGNVALSESAWSRLGVSEGALIHLSHPQPLNSLSRVRGRIFGQRLDRAGFRDIITDVAAGRYSDIHLAMFLSILATTGLDDEELFHLTEAMVTAGERLDWLKDIIVDKHCVGGLPGNRTTPLVVAIVAAQGLWIPKTSSRAITSPAGTADTMETLAPVNLDLAGMRRVVEKEGGCIVWGGAVSLSPVDDMLIRVARVMDLDTEAQLVASVISKKVAAGATHLVLDLPIGPTAKVRSDAEGDQLGRRLQAVAQAFGIESRLILSDGRQPVGRGIGPALEAHDVLAVLANAPNAPPDLRQRAIVLAGALLELAGKSASGQGEQLARQTLDSGAAMKKFEAICQAQGGLREPPTARLRFPVLAQRSGQVVEFDNRRLGRVAKLAGAPGAPAAGIELHVVLGDQVERGQALFTIHAESDGELNYAREFTFSNGDIIRLDDQAEAASHAQI